MWQQRGGGKEGGEGKLEYLDEICKVCESSNEGEAAGYGTDFAVRFLAGVVAKDRLEGG